MDFPSIIARSIAAAPRGNLSRCLTNGFPSLAMAASVMFLTLSFPSVGQAAVADVYTGQCGAYCTTLSCWRPQTGGWLPSVHDTNSVVGDPNLSASYIPQPRSAAIDFGTNLSSLGIAALNKDKAGLARPASGPWDAGAYQFTSGGGADTTPPSSPRNLGIG